MIFMLSLFSDSFNLTEIPAASPRPLLQINWELLLYSRKTMLNGRVIAGIDREFFWGHEDLRRDGTRGLALPPH